MKNIKLTQEQIIEKLNNKETFILALTATWCPPCNVIKYGCEWPTDEQKKTDKGIMQDNLINEMFMFEEHVEGKHESEALPEDVNFALVPLVEAIEAATGVKHREMTYWFNEDGSTRLEPNMSTYRPPVPSLMTVKDGVINGFWVYPTTQAHFDFIINKIK